MGLAAGGQISQKIYEDTHAPSLYDEEASERLWVHTVTSAAWEVRLHTFHKLPRTYQCFMVDDHRDRTSLVAHCARQ